MMYDDKGNTILSKEQFAEYVAEKLPGDALAQITNANGPFPIPSELVGPYVHDEHEARLAGIEADIVSIKLDLMQIKEALLCRFNINVDKRNY